jgi:GTPase-activator protein for Ras-like GTPase
LLAPRVESLCRDSSRVNLEMSPVRIISELREAAADADAAAAGVDDAIGDFNDCGFISVRGNKISGTNRRASIAVPVLTAMGIAALPSVTALNSDANIAGRVPVVQEVLRRRVAYVSHIANSLVDDINDSVSVMPYGMRLICRDIQLRVAARFPGASPGFIISLVGSYFLLRVVNPSLISPETILQLNPDKITTLSSSSISSSINNFPEIQLAQARSTLKLLAKMIQLLAVPRQTESDILKCPPLPHLANSMQPLRKWADATAPKMAEILSEICNFSEPIITANSSSIDENVINESFFRQPRISTKPKDLFDIHALLTKYIDKIDCSNTTSSSSSHIRTILDDVGSMFKSCRNVFSDPQEYTTVFMNTRIAISLDPLLIRKIATGTHTNDDDDDQVLAQKLQGKLNEYAAILQSLRFSRN